VTKEVLGIPFFQGTLKKACDSARKGGLIVAPSGPGMAQDLIGTKGYAVALKCADLILLDSGLIALWSRFFFKETLFRLSGLLFLNTYLDQTDWKNEKSFWIMPDKIQAYGMLKWLQEKYGTLIDDDCIYIAPQYSQNGSIVDENLFHHIITTNPDNVIIQLGGGVQERLGYALKSKLHAKTTILCTGAALAFLSGQQTKIPLWIDRLFMGWALRCLTKPQVFIPRYIRALKLIYLLARYGSKSPLKA